MILLHCLGMPDIQAEDQPVFYVTSPTKNGFCVNRRYAILKTLPLKSSMRQMAINNMWRHQVNFISQTITMIGITVFSNRLILFSTLKHF